MLPRIVVIGVSLGGSRALPEVLGGLPKDFPATVAVVQHRGVAMPDELLTLLQPHCALPIREVADKDAIWPGCIHVAPADYHLLVDHDGFALSTEAPVSYARPSVDVLFDSAAAAFGPAVVAVVLSGNNRDGAEGAARIKARGGIVIVQDPATTEARGMPEAAIAATAVDRVLPPSEIAAALVELCGAQKA